jgi:hypothetical protein
MNQNKICLRTFSIDWKYHTSQKFKDGHDLTNEYFVQIMHKNTDKALQVTDFLYLQ